MKKHTVTASEAVFGFAAWLTGRIQGQCFGAHFNSAPAAELAGLWCDENKLPRPRKIFPKNIIQPKE